MAHALTSESRRLYSWWWDSHISPKNSKWLQENLTEMDTKVKSMIKLIEIDADSFARRAEMYYKKRPELMKLVEEFYRAYRALAERYDHANSELRHAQKTLQAAFADQEPSSSTDPSAIKHICFCSQLFGEDKSEVERLKIAELFNADEVNRVQEKSLILEENAKSEEEVDMMKENLCITKQTEHMETVSDMEKNIVVTKDEVKMFAEQAVIAEMEVEKLKTALMEVTNEKEGLRDLYEEYIEKSYALELDLFSAQEDVKRLTAEIENSTKKVKQAEEMCICLETSNQSLKKEIMLKDKKLSKKHDDFVEFKQMKERLEKEVALQSDQCLSLQKEIFDLKEEITKLNMTHLNPESFGSSVKYLQDKDSSSNTDLQSSLGSNLLKESVQKRLEVLENRFTQFEKEKETGNSQMLKLVSSTVEKGEHESLMMLNEKRLDELESKLKKQELQEELDKAVIAQFENFILHKYVKEVEEDNYVLSVEIKKHIEASKFADKLISELETEILEQQVEEELLLVEVENLRKGIHQVFLSLGVRSKSNPAKMSVEEIVSSIKDLKHCLLQKEDDKQRVVIENIVISTVLMEKYETMKIDFLNVKKENLALVEVNENLGLELVMSNTHGIVFESKIHELVEVCESLEGESVLKDQENEEIHRKASVVEREIEGLKAQLLAYTPVIGSLKENISSLEHNLFTVANLVISNSHKAEVQDAEQKAHPQDNQHDPESTSGPEPLRPKGISELIELQTRIAALEKVIVEDINTVARRKTSGLNTKPKPAKLETEESNPNDHQKRNKEDKLRGKQRYITLDHLNIPKTKPEFLEMRDIPLDQASDGSSSAKSRSRSRRAYLRSDNMLLEQPHISHKFKKLPYEPQVEDFGVYKLQASNRESKKGKLLQRLESDAHKLANLESTVKDLKKRLEASKKSKKHNGVDFKIVKEQLEEAEETISQLTNVNIESTTNAEKNASLAAWLEQDDTWTRSERIKTVQLDVQNIQCMLMKLDDEKKSKGKGRFSVSKSRTSVVLSDFIHRGGRNRRRRLCGCFTSSMSKGDRVKS